MTVFKFISVFQIFMVLSVLANAQNECKVLVPELSGSYFGKCKKGLAHGKGKALGIDSYDGNFRKGLPHGGGVYKWENGAIYDGDWREGLRDGKGVYNLIVIITSVLLIHNINLPITSFFNFKFKSCMITRSVGCIPC